MTNNSNVQAIEHTDVRGNKLLYLKITVGNGEVLVNIGQKTYDAVTKLTAPREEKTVVNILGPEPKK